MPLCRLAVLAALVAFPACDSITSGGDRVVLATSVSPTELAAGDTALIGVTINNLALSTATVESSTCASMFEVFDSQGNVVGPEPISDCGTNALPAPLRAGEAFTLAAVWTGTLSGSTPANPIYAAPGTYRIRGRAVIRELGEPVTGRTITIRITE